MASQKGLGKGLGALLGDFSEEPLEKSAYQQAYIFFIFEKLRGLYFLFRRTVVVRFFDTHYYKCSYDKGRRIHIENNSKSVSLRILSREKYRHSVSKSSRRPDHRKAVVAFHDQRVT